MLNSWINVYRNSFNYWIKIDPCFLWQCLISDFSTICWKDAQLCVFRFFVFPTTQSSSLWQIIACLSTWSSSLADLYFLVLENYQNIISVIEECDIFFYVWRKIVEKDWSYSKLNMHIFEIIQNTTFHLRPSVSLLNICF